jgi:hypothetical protein
VVDADLPALIDARGATSAPGRTPPGPTASCAPCAQPRRASVALGADPSLPFTQAVARSLLKLMSYKDEYEVARLYTDGRFQRALHDQFEGDLQLEFHMAPPLLSRARQGQPPRKLRLGPWLLPAAEGAGLRPALARHGAGPVRPHRERRLERQLITDFEQRVAELLATLDARACRWPRPSRACRCRCAASATSSWPAWRWRGRARPNCCTAGTRRATRGPGRPAGRSVQGHRHGQGLNMAGNVSGTRSATARRPRGPRSGC